MAKILVPLAPGFEEIEAVTIIDILRRAQLDVTTVSLGTLEVTGAHNISIRCDSSIDSIQSKDYDMMILPGGQPGTDNLKADDRVIKLLQEFAQADKMYGAICAAPSVLAHAGLIQDKTVTSFPSYADKLGRVHYTEKRVALDHKVITSRGAGTAGEFALAIVALFKGQGIADQLQGSMLYPRGHN